MVTSKQSSSKIHDQKSIPEPEQTTRQAKNNSVLKIMMLPHSSFWEVVIMTTIIIQLNLVFINITYAKFDGIAFWIMMQFICDIFFCADIISIILHRHFSIHKNDVCTRRIPTVIVILCCMSILPIYYIYIEYIGGTLSEQLWSISLVKGLVRILRVIFYFKMKRHEAGVDQFKIIFFHTFYLFTFYSTAGTCLLYSLGCYKCEIRSWTVHLEDYVFRNTSVLDSFLIPYTFIGGLVAGNYAGVITGTTFWENVVIVFTIFVGTVLKLMIFEAQLIQQYINVHRKQRLFNSRLMNIFHFVDSHNFDKDLQADVKEFYNVLWHKREAILSMPPCFKLLPLSLQKEVTLDLFWDALKHSHLFKNVDITFKRDLSLLMESEFLLAGDFLYNTDELKSKLIYIRSGIVQILSDEDDESPVVSFSSGTILSELACLMATRSECMIRCATYCEFTTLSLPTLFRKLLDYRHRSRDLQKKLNDRLTEARKFNSYKMADLSTTHLSKPLRRLKNEWKMMHRRDTFEKEVVVSHSHTSKYLDLLVMSDEMELKVEVICLTSKFPFILDPDSSFRAFCNMLCFAAVVLQCLIIPYCAAFHRWMHSEIRKLCMVLDFIYVFDIAIQTTTAIKEKDKLITNFGEILQGRFREFKFQIDLVATLPFDYIGFFGGCTPHMFVLLKIPRTFKVYRAVSYIQKFEKKLFTNPSYIILYKYMILFSIILYFSMCILYMKACFTATCDYYSWYSYNRRLDIWNEKDGEIITALRSLYTVVALITGAGYGDSSPYTATDSFCMFILIVVGYYLMKYCTSELISAKYWGLHQKTTHKILLNSVLTFAHVHKFKHNIVFRIENTLRFRWDYNKNLIHNDAYSIFDETTKNLHTRISYHLITSFLESSRFFQMCDEELLKLISFHCKMIAYAPRSIIISSDTIGAYIYIIQKGYCQLESNVPGDVERCTNRTILKTGDCFPIVEVFHEIPTFVSVISVTTVEVVAVPYQKLLTCLRLNQDNYVLFKQALEIHYQDNLSIFGKKHKQHISNRKFRRKYENMFVYDKPTTIACKRRIHMASPLMRAFTGSFYPNGKFFLFAEWCRCIFAVIQFIIVVFYLNLFFYYRYVLDIINIILDITCWFYIYIRMRLHYYHENGILVTDKSSIMRHYMRSSFYLDVYSSFPFKLLGIGFLFSVDRHIIDLFLLLISRPLQLYRVFQFITYMTKTSKISEKNIYRLKFFIFLMALILISANLMEIYICGLKNNELVCEATVWQIQFQKDVSNYKVIIVYCIYFVTEYFTLFQSRIFTRPSNGQFCFIVGLLVLFVLMNWTVLSTLTSSGLHGVYMFTQLQNDRTNFKIFAKQESMSDEIVDKLLRSNEYLTSNVENVALELANSRFAPQLTEDILYFMYKKTLRNMALLAGANESFFKYFSSKLTRIHYKKDAIIIRINDVQNKLYIVKKGKVDLTVASSKLITLGSGGMFGCFTKSGYVRQTVEAKATLHTELLTLNNSDFWWHIMKCPWIKKRLEQFILTNPEYVAPLKTIQEDVESTKSAMLDYKRVTNFSKIVNSIFKGRFLEVIEYILNVHLSSISAIYTLILMLISLNQRPSFCYFLIFYMIDCIFLLKIFFGFSLSYVDESSGLVIDDYKLIIKKYLKTNFFLDFFTILMPELYFYSFWQGSVAFTVLSSNRTFRIIFLVNYYQQFTVKNKVTHALRWVYLIYLSFFYIQLCANVWSYVACFKDFCKFRTSLSQRNVTYQFANSTEFSTLMVYKYIFNVFSVIGIRAFSPLKIDELLTSSLMFVSGIYMTCTIVSSCTIIQIIDNYSIGQYDYNIGEIKTYLLNQKLSPAIFKRVWRYYLLLWKFQNGEHLPSLIMNAADYLKQDAMKDIYGHHLQNHYLFQNTHVDFIRQLLAHMKRRIFPSGYTIVEKGDIDGCMYFIHSGIVAVVEKLDLLNNELYRLQKKDSFGEKQGLDGSGHDYSYMAVSTVVDILILNKNDWGYLLKFFPATVEEIRTRAGERFDLDEF